MTIFTDTDLETTDYATPEWVAIYNSNIYRLNNLLLKISGLIDVDVAGIEHGSVLKWNTSTSKWEVYTS